MVSSLSTGSATNISSNNSKNKTIQSSNNYGNKKKNTFRYKSNGLLTYRIVFFVLILLHFTIQYLIHKTIPDPYMDEIFHFPQTKTYCLGNYNEWDPMITTFPGLYICGLSFTRFLYEIQKTLLSFINSYFPDQKSIFTLSNEEIGWCSLTRLRFMNSIFHIGVFMIVCLILNMKRNENGNFNGKMNLDNLNQALIIAFYPTIFFYSFLYYTDLCSIFFLLLGYYVSEHAIVSTQEYYHSLSTKGSSFKNVNNIQKERLLPWKSSYSSRQWRMQVIKHIISAFCCSLAILMRQTNAIWSFYLLGKCLISFMMEKETKMFEQDEKKERKEKEEEMQRSYGKRSDTPRYRGGGNRNNKSTNTSGGSNIQKKKGTSQDRSTNGIAESRIYEEQQANNNQFNHIWYILFLPFSAMYQVLSSQEYFSYLILYLWPYFIPIFGFLYFVLFQNEGSIVVGDKQHHQPAFHLAQISYFLVIVQMVYNPIAVLDFQSFWRKPIQEFSNFIYNSLFLDKIFGYFHLNEGGDSGDAGGIAWLLKGIKVVITIATFIGGGILICKLTFAHPYLLADNRHYTFYVWKMFFRDRPYMNLFLFPLYYVCGYSIFVAKTSSISKRGSLYSLYLFLCCALTLIPASLLEPRYFNVPLIITLLELPAPQSSPDSSFKGEIMQLINRKCVVSNKDFNYLLVLVLFLFVNIITVYVFLFETFSDDNGVQRFMW